MKTDEQWCKDNGVPQDARHAHLFSGYDTIAIVNAMLKKHGVRIRTKQRRGTGSYVWVEKRLNNS